MNCDINDIDTIPTERERRILAVFQKKRNISIEEAASMLNVSKSTLNRTIREMKKKGLIGREGNNRNGCWVVMKKAKE